MFWLGDFNFRIDNLPAYEIKQAIERENYDLLACNDQLIKSKSSGISVKIVEVYSDIYEICHVLGFVFNGFEEGPLIFAPTYKYDLGTNVYDTRYLENLHH